MHCFQHKITRKIFATKGEGETKKIRAQQKMVVQKEDWESSIQSSYDKKKNEKARPKSSTVTMMNDSMGWKKQETLNLKIIWIGILQKRLCQM